MAMTATEIERLIREAIPDAEVTITDLAGDGARPGCTSMRSAMVPDTNGVLKEVPQAAAYVPNG